MSLEHEQLCGGPPNVTLSCTNGTAYVDWVASKPGCQFDCKAYWICTGPNVTHTEEVGTCSQCCIVYN